MGYGIGMNETTKQSIECLIDAFIAERGCSRLIAAGYAAQACIDEYNNIQKRLGSTARSRIVDAGWSPGESGVSIRY